MDLGFLWNHSFMISTDFILWDVTVGETISVIRSGTLHAPEGIGVVPGPFGANHGQAWLGVGGGTPPPPPSVDRPPAAAPVGWLV